MKNKLFVVGMLAGILGLAQADATPITFTESISYGNPGIEVYNNPYTGAFTEASLLSGQTVFNTSLYSISSAIIDLTMVDASGHTVSLTVNGFEQSLSDTKSPQTLAYTLTSEDSYITAQFAKYGKFNFTAEADCYLQSVELIVTASAIPTNPNESSVPDMATTVLLLGSSLLGLEILRRKFAPAKA